MHAEAAEPIPGPVPAEIVDIVDGDTISVRARIWPGQFVETRVRLRGVDTPETRRPDCEAERAAGREATAFTRAWLTAPNVDAESGALTAPDRAEAADAAPRFVAISLHEVDLGSFAGRVVARVERGGEDLSTALLNAGLASVYGVDGPWCASAASEASD
jgi:endonuclease YncB( thermonuclease family)